jgi:hypothetical protein
VAAYYCVMLEVLCHVMSRNSSVSIVTRLRAGRPGFGFRRGRDVVLFATAFRPTLGPIQPLVQCVTGALSSGVKRPRREADHSHPSKKNAWSHNSAPPYVFMACRLVKYRDFTFYVEACFMLACATFWELCLLSFSDIGMVVGLLACYSNVSDFYRDHRH